MARTYKVPIFPLQCNIWRLPTIPPTVPAVLTIPCQLRMMKTAFTSQSHIVSPGVLMLLLVAKGTDIRDGTYGVGNEDTVEVPAGTGRYYRVQNVDDVAKGFVNEYRAAAILRITNPLPLP